MLELTVSLLSLPVQQTQQDPERLRLISIKDNGACLANTRCKCVPLHLALLF